MMFVQNELSFYLLRVLLGAAEAGLFPAMMYMYAEARCARRSWTGPSAPVDRSCARMALPSRSLAKSGRNTPETSPVARPVTVTPAIFARLPSTGAASASRSSVASRDDADDQRSVDLGDQPLEHLS